MLPSRGLLRAVPSPGLAKRAIPRARTSLHPALQTGRGNSPRHFGTNLQRTRVAPRSTTAHGPLTSGRIGGSIALAGVLPTHQLLFRSQQSRYASTEPSPAVDAATAASSSATPEVASTPIDIADITGSDLLDMPEQVGYLQAIGLDFGYGPTATMQWLLEHVYIYSGMPWWASIAAVAVIIRVAIFKPSLTAAEHSHKLQELRKNPRFADAMKRMQESAMVSGNQAEMMAARTETKNMQRAAGVQTWRAFVPMINVPIAYGMLRLIRGMASLPVPSLENGGALWFTDLTIPDPLFILPIASSGLLYFVMKMNTPYMAPQQAKIMRFAAVAMTPLSLFVTIYFPAGLQWFFLMTGMLQYLQTWLFYQPWLRRWANLPDLVVKDVTPAASPQTSPFSAKSAAWQAPRTISTTARPAKEEGTGVMTTLKGGYKSFQEKMETGAKGKKKATELKQAQAYEDRRALEEQEKYHARREERAMRKREARARKP